jgi:hypothetical protein
MSNNYRKIFMNGIAKENPVFRLLLLQHQLSTELAWVWLQHLFWSAQIW